MVTRDAYDSLMKDIGCNKSDKRWFYLRHFNIEPTSWKQIYLFPGKGAKDNKLQEIHYKILHGIAVLNPLSSTTGVKNDVSCTFCHKDIEMVEHVFHERKETQIF